MIKNRKEKCVFLIKQNGNCSDDETCSECSIESECSTRVKYYDEIEEEIYGVAVDIFLTEFGTKADLVEILI